MQLNLLTLCLLLLGWQIQAQSMEDFDYPVGETIEGKDGGTGWTGVWTVLKGNDETEIVNDDAVGLGGTALRTNHVSGDSGSRFYRQLDNPVTDDGGTYYLSWYQDADYDDPANNGSVAQVIITASANYGAGGPGGQLVRMGKIFGTENFGVDGNGLGPSTAPDTDTREPMFVVAVIEMSGDDGNETVKFYFDPDQNSPLDLDDPDHMIMRDMNTGFDAIGYKNEGGGTLTATVDRIRFGTTISEVTDASVAFEPFDYDIGAMIEGQNGPGAWNGPWVTLKGNDETSVVDQGIISTGVGFNSGGPSLYTDHPAGASGSRFYRQLADPVTDDGGTYWLSWFQDADYDNPAGNGSVAQVILTASANFGSGGPGGQLVRMGKLFGTMEFGVDGTAGASGTTTGFDTRNGMWVVVQVVMSGDDGAETLNVYIDPDPNSMPMATDADLSLSPTLNNGFDAIGYKNEGGGALEAYVDEIRFADNFMDVISGNLEPALGAASDNFNDYAPGASLDGQDGGSGTWGGPWMAEAGADQMTIVDDSLTNFTLLKATSGNKLSFDYTQAGTPNLRVSRPLAVPVTDDGGEYFVSYHTMATLDDPANTVTYFMLIDTAAYAATGPGGQLVQIGKPLNTATIGVGVGAASNFSMTGASIEQAQFVVARIKMSGDDSPDSVFLYVNPPLDALPATADAVKEIGTNLNNGFNALGFKTEGINPGITAMYDDLYFGTSYSDVLPDDLSDVESPIDAFVADKFNTYNTGEALVGQGGDENGWAGPWMNLETPDSSIVLAGGILNNQLGAATSGNRARVVSPGTNNRIQRLFDEPITPATGEFWFSVHMGVSGTLGGNVGTFNFVDTSQMGGNFQQLFIGKQFGSNNLFAAGFGTGGGTQTGEQFDGNTGRWVVGHVVYNGSDMNWELDVWVDPAADPSMTPMEADANIMNKMYAGNDYHGIMLKSEGAAGLNFDVDDILLGSTFSDVVPDDLSVLPPLPNGASEKFNDYAAGEGLEGQTGGEGFDGPWTLINGDDPTIVGNGLTNFYLLKETSGNSVEFSSNARVVRSLEGEYGDVGRTFWMSWMYGTINGGPNVAHLVLADEDNYTSSGAGGQLAQIGKGFGNTDLVLVGHGAAPNVTTDTINWVVAQIVTNGTADPDDIYIWVNPDPGSMPSQDTAAISGTANLTNWNAVGFKVEGDPGVVARWDDVLLGNNFAEIVPDDWTDVDPPAVPVVAYEGFDYNADQDLNGLDGGEGWATPWMMTSGTAEIDEGSIDSDRAVLLGNKVDLNMTDDDISYNRMFTNPFLSDDDDSDQIWFTFLQQIDQKSIGASALVGFMNGTDVLFSIGGVPGSDQVALNYNGDQQEISTNVNAIGTNWMVGRMDDNDDGTVTLRVWANPVADALPDDNNTLFTVDNLNLDQLSGIQVAVAGVGTARMFVDEIRTGFSFRDVSSKFGSDDPDLFAYEPFNYDAGQSLVGLGGINAFWDGVWENGGNLASNSVVITPGSVAFPEFETIGNKAEMNYVEEGTQIRITRPLAVDMVSDGSTYWLTWFQNTTTGDQLNNVANISLRNSGIANKFGQRLNIGRMFGNGKFGVIAPPQNATQNTEEDDIGLNWVVVKIQTVDDPAVPDSVFLWINPAAEPGMQPDTAQAELFNMSDFRRWYPTLVLKDGIDHIMLKSEGVNGDEVPHIFDFDEIRIATAWQSALTVTNTVEPNAEDPFRLAAYPNPVVSELQITYESPESGYAQLAIFDNRGQHVTTLHDGQIPQGEQQFTWRVGEHASGIADGIYYLRLQQGTSVSVRKLILLRR